MQVTRDFIKVLLLLAPGCGNSLSMCSSGSEKAATDARLQVVDAGVVLVDRPFYFCIPVEELGLDSREKIASLHSSCDCVNLTLVELYPKGNQDPPQAILLESERLDGLELSSRLAKFSPIDLRINVQAKLLGGGNCEFVIKFAESKLSDTAAKHLQVVSVQP